MYVQCIVITNLNIQRVLRGTESTGNTLRFNAFLFLLVLIQHVTIRCRKGTNTYHTTGEGTHLVRRRVHPPGLQPSIPYRNTIGLSIRGMFCTQPRYVYNNTYVC